MDPGQSSAEISRNKTFEFILPSYLEKITNHVLALRSWVLVEALEILQVFRFLLQRDRRTTMLPEEPAK